MSQENQNNDDNRWIAFVDSDELAQVISSLSNRTSQYEFLVHKANPRTAIEHIKINNPYTQIILDISQDPDPIHVVSEFAEYCLEGTHLIAIGKDDNIQLYRELKNLGVDDYFSLPVTEKQLLNTISAITRDRLQAQGVTTKTAKQVTIITPRGGMLASFISLNLAWLLAEEQKADVCLVDWDMYFSLIPLTLNLEANQGLSDALLNTDRLDKTFLKSLVAQKTKRLSVLATEQPLDITIPYSANEITKLWDVLSSCYDVIILNLPYNNIFLDTDVLEQSEYILMVLDATLASARDATNIIQASQNVVSSDKFKFILMKNKKESVNEIFKQHIKKSIHQSIDYSIDFDRDLLSNSLNAGQALAELKPKHPGITTLRKLAQALHTPTATVKKSFNYKQALSQLTNMIGKLSKKRD